MSKELQDDAKRKCITESLSEAEFLEQASERFPGVSFLVGPGRHLDDLGQAYQTICIGGVKHEGFPFTHVVLTGPTSFEDYLATAHVWDSWWKSFGEYIPKAGTVYVRRAPEYACWVEYVLDTFSGCSPMLVPKQYSQISGRFSFHKKEEPISG